MEAMGLSASSPAAAGQAPNTSQQRQAASAPSECPMHQEKTSGN